MVADEFRIVDSDRRARRIDRRRIGTVSAQVAETRLRGDRRNDDSDQLRNWRNHFVDHLLWNLFPLGRCVPDHSPRPLGQATHKSIKFVLATTFKAAIHRKLLSPIVVQSPT